MRLLGRFAAMRLAPHSLAVMHKRHTFIAVLIAILIALLGCAESPNDIGSNPMPKDIRIGDRLKLWGGYEQEPLWLGGNVSVTGTVEKFIPGQNTEKAMVVRLDVPLSAKGVTGRIIVLELRYVGARWAGQGVAHVELCDFEPEDKPWKDRRQGVWVESHASFKPL